MDLNPANSYCRRTGVLGDVDSLGKLFEAIPGSFISNLVGVRGTSRKCTANADFIEPQGTNK